MLWEKIKDTFSEEDADLCIKELIEGSSIMHDLTNGAGIGIDTLYCTTVSCKNVLYNGRPYYKLHSVRPKHAVAYMGQIIEYILDNSNIFAGAISPTDIFVGLAKFTKDEKLSDKEIIQLLQSFVHIINNPYRPNFQSPFVSISLLTQNGIEKAFGAYKYPDSTLAIDYMDEILKIQKLFSEYFGKGIEQENDTFKPASFPVATINVIRDTYKEDREYIVELIKNMSKFLNFNLYIGSAFKFSTCCALINDFTKKNSINSFGIGSFGEDVIGSSRVVSIDLYHIALESKNRNIDFFDLLKEKLEINFKSLYAQRLLAQDSLDGGYNVFYNLGWIKLQDFFSSYGCGGLHECVKTLSGGNLNEDYNDEEIKIAKQIPVFIETFCEEKSDDFIKLNLEFLTPLESGARRLGKRVDIKYNKENTMISNRLLPTHIKVPLSRRIEIEQEIGGSASAGGLCHLHVEGETSVEVIMSILDTIVSDYQDVELIAFNKPISYCENNHTIFKDLDTCDICGGKIVTKISRTVGYWGEYSTYNESRKTEFSNRAWFSEKEQEEFKK
jgi:anaerobic ribonucleoside-triphosphate reductase